MANKTGYTLAKNTPVHEITGYFPNKEGILVMETRKVQGLTPFGPQAGVITEDDLTPAIVEFLMSKTDADAKTKTYEKYLVKGKAEKEPAETTAPGADKK